MIGLTGYRQTGLVIFFCLLFILFLGPASAEAVTLPTLELGVEETDDPGQLSVLIQILLIFTVLSVAPAILLMTTCFTRLIVVFSFLKHALGTQQMPPPQIMIGLSLFLTLFIMTPIFKDINEKAVRPYLSEEITLQEAYDGGINPLRNFMFKQTREKDLSLFLSITDSPRPQNKEEVATTILMPAFVISELKTAFQIGFVLFLPFLIIDMVVASVLLSMGMMMLPPVMVSLPFKLLLFVLVDGWYLIVGSLVKSFGV